MKTQSRRIPESEIDVLLRTAMWWRELERTNNLTFLPLFSDEHRYLVLMGGGGSGKSIFAGRKILERVTSEPGHRILVVRKVARTIRESCFKQLIGQAHEYYPESGLSVNKSDMRMTVRNGSEIIFAGLDDVEKLKSIYAITGIWIEEATELLESDFNQLNIRLRGETEHYKQIIITFNPVHINHWLKKRFFETPDPDALTHHSTYRDNRFLDPESIGVLESFRETDEYYYTVYALGQWGVLGRTIFNAKEITDRITKLSPPIKQGYFEYDYDGLEVKNIRFIEDGGGFIKIYSEPEAGRPYVIGGDTAGEGSDSFTAQVLDNITGKQVCTLKHTFDEDVYARQMYCLGKYYNTALLGIECNFSTYPVKEIARLGYENLYMREREDKATGEITDSYGFMTTRITRPVVIAGLVQVAREDISIFNDEETLHEMLTFVRDEHFVPRAENGAHDDLVMAAAIAYYIRPQQQTAVTRAPGEKKRWETDQWEDYYSANEETRRKMLLMWGEPL